MTLTFVTSNDHKFATAQHICQQLDIELVRERLDIIEIQADNGEDIARHKAEAAFQLLKRSLVVTDDTWHIPGLNGFPGPYMKYMNEWLTPDDFLRLTAPLQNREVILRHVLAYHDATQQKVFSADIKGALLPEVRGESPFPFFTIISFDDGQHSAAELSDVQFAEIVHTQSAWPQLGKWHNEK